MSPLVSKLQRDPNTFWPFTLFSTAARDQISFPWSVMIFTLCPFSLSLFFFQTFTRMLPHTDPTECLALTVLPVLKHTHIYAYYIGRSDSISIEDLIILFTPSSASPRSPFLTNSNHMYGPVNSSFAVISRRKCRFLKQLMAAMKKKRRQPQTWQLSGQDYVFECVWSVCLTDCSWRTFICFWKVHRMHERFSLYVVARNVSGMHVS